MEKNQIYFFKRFFLGQVLDKSLIDDSLNASTQQGKRGKPSSLKVSSFAVGTPTDPHEGASRRRTSLYAVLSRIVVSQKQPAFWE